MVEFAGEARPVGTEGLDLRLQLAALAVLLAAAIHRCLQDVKRRRQTFACSLQHPRLIRHFPHISAAACEAEAAVKGGLYPHVNRALRL